MKRIISVFGTASMIITLCALLALCVLCSVTASAQDLTLGVLETVSLSNPTGSTAEHTYSISLPDSGYIKLFAGNAASGKNAEVSVCGKSGTLGELLGRRIPVTKGEYTLSVKLDAGKSVSDLCYAFVSDSGKKSASRSIALTGKRYRFASYSDTVKWTTSDRTIASVDSKGRITPKRAGEVTIRGYGKNGNYICQKLYCVEPVAGEFSGSTVLAGTDEDFTEAMLGKLLKKYNMTVIYDYSMNMYAFGLSRELDAGEMAVLLKKLELEKGVIYAEPDYIIRLDDPVMTAPAQITLF